MVCGWAGGSDGVWVCNRVVLLTIEPTGLQVHPNC